MLYIAGLILFLHNVVPHYHKGESIAYDKEISFDQANSILDFVKIMFLVDLGEGHLDHFDSSEYDSLSNISDNDLPSFDQISIVTEMILILEDQCYLPLRIEDYFPPPNLYINIPILRGPPNFKIG